MKTEFNKKEMDILSSIFSSVEEEMKCPNCGGDLVLIQVEPVLETKDEGYISYDTVIECTTCPFIFRAESFTILGCVNDYDSHHIEIWSWSPSGSRVLSRYEHVLDYDVLKKLKKTEELVEFLVVNKHVVQVIG